MARVYVVGGGGSGKSTLAEVLAARLGCPLRRLDDVLPAPGAPGSVARERCEAAVRSLVAGESWVLEGNFPRWLAEAADRADVVVWLDVPFRVAAGRILRRHLAAELRHRNPYPGARRLWRFLVNQRRYYADTPGAYRRRVAADSDRWSGALYGRAAVAAQAAGAGDRVLRVTCGSVEAIAAGVCARCHRAAEPDGRTTGG